MIKMIVEKQGQYFIITIDKKKVLYWDKYEGALWGGPLQYLPPDAMALIKIDMSRNKIPATFKDMLKVSAEELKEFEEAKDENELKEVILRDLVRNKCKLIDMKIE